MGLISRFPRGRIFVLLVPSLPMMLIWRTLVAGFTPTTLKWLTWLRHCRFLVFENLLQLRIFSRLHACWWYLSGHDPGPHTLAAGAGMSPIFDPRSTQATAQHASHSGIFGNECVGIVIFLTLLYVLMAVATSPRLLNECNTFDQMQRPYTRKGFSNGSSHRVLCVRWAPHVIYFYVNFLPFCSQVFSVLSELLLSK